MSLILAVLAGFAGLQAQDHTVPKILPTRVCDTSPMTIFKDKDFEYSLAVINYDNHFTYLADHGTGTTIPYYWTDDEVLFRANQLFSLDFDVDPDSGNPRLRKVFEKPGTYKFIFSDNLHTEYENSVTVIRTVTYLGKSHPECPKFPLE